MEILLHRSSRSMSSSELAKELNRSGLYSRKDGRSIRATQVSARARNYPLLFSRSDGHIELVCSAAIEDTGKSGDKLQVATDCWGMRWPAELEDPSFQRLGTLRELLDSGLPSSEWLSRCGVYVLLIKDHATPRFIDEIAAKASGNVVQPWSAERLRQKWVVGARVIYVGLAGRKSQRSLRARLNDLLRHAKGHTSSNGPHKGGEIVWQLDGWQDLELYATPTSDPPSPRTAELSLTISFEREFGKLPFGNRRH